MSTELPNEQTADDDDAQVLRGTFTTEEAARLEGWLPKYLLIKRVRGKKFADLWAALFHDFFTHHPLASLTPEELASGVDQGKRVGERQRKVQKRIKEWFNNHSRTATSGTGKRKLLDLTKNTGSRMLAPYQAYGRMNKKDVGPIINKEWSDKVISQRHTEDERVKPVPPVPIDFRNSVLKRLLAAEPGDIQDAVDVWRHANRPGEKVDSVEGVDDFDQAEAYYQTQLSLGPTLQVILENIQQQSGMIGFFTLVGPRPMYNGDLGVITVFHGQNQAGHDFGDIYTASKWKENVEEPLLSFATTIFPPSVCRSLARHNTPTPVPSIIQSTSSTPGPSTVVALPKVRKADILKLLPIDEDDGDEDFKSDNDAELFDFFKQPSGKADSSTPAADTTPSPNPQGHEPGTTEGAGALDKTMEGLQNQEPVDESLAQMWDNGAHVTPEERRVLMMLPSDIERTSIMNIRLRDCQALEAGLIEKLPPIVAKPVPGEKKTSGKKKKKDKVVNSAAGKTAAANPRRSDRQKLSDPTPPLPHSDHPTPTPSTSTIPILSHASSRALGIDNDAIPSWVEDFVEHLSPMCGDEQWNSLLVKWVDLERQLGFPTKGRGKAQMLSAANRPTQIGVWINDNRLWTKMPPIGPGAAEDYSTSWWLWWRSLQPEWRALNLSYDLRGHGDFKWDETRKGSQNGFGIVILSLGWWFAGLKTTKGKWGCAGAMKDVEWVLDQMLASGQSISLGKRSRGDGGSCPPTSKRGKKY